MRTLLGLLSLLFFLPETVTAQSMQALRWDTSNGVHVIFFPAMEVPMLDINLAFKAGSAYDGSKFGISSLTTQLLNQGNGGFSANEIADQLAETGAQFQAQSSRDMVVLSLKTLTQPAALKRATHVFSLIVNQPDFKDQAFTRHKNQQLMAIKQGQDSPDNVANDAFFKTLYQEHPYAHPVIGTEQTIAQIQPKDVKEFYQQSFVGKKAILVLVGAIDERKARAIALQISQKLPPGNPAAPIPKAMQAIQAKTLKIDYPSSQSIIRLGQLGIDHHDPDYFNLLVGNYILGGGTLVSQLAHEIREKRGLSYGVYSLFLPLPGLGPFIISLSTKTDQAKTAVDLTRKTVVSFLQKGPNEQELQNAKRYLVGSFPLSLASNSNIANMLLKIAFYQLPNDYLDAYPQKINAVSRDEIRKAMQKHIMPERFVQITVGKP